MRITFKIEYIAKWGETLALLIYEASDRINSYAMQCSQVSQWSVNIEFPNSTNNIIYQYGIIDAQGEMHPAYGGERKIHDLPGIDCIVQDQWRGPYGDVPFSSKVFQECFFVRNNPHIAQSKKNVQLILNLNCPQMEPNRHFAIVGNQACLGNWDVAKKVRLDEQQYPIWSIAFAEGEIKFPLEYKYLIVDTATDEVLAWGGGPNRMIKKAPTNACKIKNDEHFLRTIPSWKGTGVAIPIFSLRSKSGFGVGEFNDLKLMVDWAVKTGQKLIQTLPINDTVLYHTNYDSYPYNAVSVYALHPIYLNLEKVGKIKNKDRKSYFDALKKELNDKTFSDYQNVMNAKWEYLREIFEQEGKKVFEKEDYKTFFESNSEWLIPYAAFSFLRDKYKTPEFGLWDEFSIFDRQEIENFCSPKNAHYNDISFYYFIQYHLHLQLTEVHNYAHTNGIAIKGDIPIGVSPKSVDAWVDPQLFNRQVQAGAPPDDFSVTGQNWGFPTYNWELMAKDGYQWWRKRFEKMAEYFDAYRIDHILGFFRIWEIPENDVWGLTGSFHPALPYTRNDLQKLGLWWDEDRFVKPYMRQHVLYSIFGKFTDEVIREYLLPDGWQNFKFKPEYDTQKKIEKHFANLGYNFGNKELLIRDGLYALHCEVLFVRDVRDPEKFHPRISMHSSASFRDLNDETRRLLDKLYVDYFYHRHTDFWKEKAYEKLPALISATKMLVCGEDLGMVPDSVPDVMNSLEILSLEIQRMPKKANAEFAMPKDAPYRSVCTTSTHDMNPIRAWWEEDRAITQKFYNKGLEMPGNAPEKCEQWIAERIVVQHLESTAMWVILPWQDWMAIEPSLCLEHPFAERINVPSDPRNFWCYRMHISLEKLLKEEKFNVKLKELIQSSGR